jgi:hypothetical protein
MRFILKGSILVLFIFYITSSTVNEQYLVWVIPFLILYMKTYDQALEHPFYYLCILDSIFVLLNVGLNFLEPIIDMSSWWIRFRYSAPSIILIILTGIFFQQSA